MDYDITSLRYRNYRKIEGISEWLEVKKLKRVILFSRSKYDVPTTSQVFIFLFKIYLEEKKDPLKIGRIWLPVGPRLVSLVCSGKYCPITSISKHRIANSSQIKSATTLPSSPPVLPALPPVHLPPVHLPPHPAHPWTTRPPVSPRHTATPTSVRSVFRSVYSRRRRRAPKIVTTAYFLRSTISSLCVRPKPDTTARRRLWMMFALRGVNWSVAVWLDVLGLVIYEAVGFWAAFLRVQCGYGWFIDRKWTGEVLDSCLRLF